jgi:hypothetical protein
MTCCHVVECPPLAIKGRVHTCHITQQAVEEPRTFTTARSPRPHLQGRWASLPLGPTRLARLRCRINSARWLSVAGCKCTRTLAHSSTPWGSTIGRHTQFALVLLMHARTRSFVLLTPHPEPHAPSPLLREDVAGMCLRQTHPNTQTNRKDASRGTQENTRRLVGDSRPSQQAPTPSTHSNHMHPPPGHNVAHTSPGRGAMNVQTTHALAALL